MVNEMAGYSRAPCVPDPFELVSMVNQITGTERGPTNLRVNEQMNHWLRDDDLAGGTDTRAICRPASPSPVGESTDRMKCGSG
jgi:hypothetical protein